MPFSSVLGSSSVIKPGVCTSTTRPTVPYEGQLIYETDTDRVAAYNGSAWVYTHSSGLVFITGATFTAVTSFSLPQGTFSSNYANYKMNITLTACTSDADFTVRLRTSGTDNTSALYDYALLGLGTTTTSNSQSGGQTSFAFGETDVANVRSIYNFDIFNPNLALRTSLLGSYAYVPKSPTDLIGRTGYWQFNGTTVFDSLSFISSVASSVSGTYRVYGYADS
jgi:hypothetical protein